MARLEEWCEEKGAEYAYMATPTMLVQPVHAHYKPISSGVTIVRVPPDLAETMYRRVFANSEFFPNDINAIIASKLNLGTFMAVPKKSLAKWDPLKGEKFPPSFAILSVWNTKEVFKLQVKGVTGLTYACCVASQVVDTWMPWLRLPSFPDVFRQFGVFFLYGLHMEGRHGVRLMKSLCTFAYNMARDDGDCGALVAEVGQWDPVRAAIPHWRRFSLAEDLWCIKSLKDGAKHRGESREGFEPSDWVNSRSSSSSVIFVDPRDF